jgi:heat shock protein HslJ
VIKQSSFIAFLLLTLAVLAACSSSTSVPTGPSSNTGSTNLTTAEVGGTWALTSIQPADRDEQATPASAIYSLTLNGDRVSSQVDCNRRSGQLLLGVNMLRAGPALACTRAACRTMEFENAYLALLSGESQVRADASTLTLSSPRGVLRFRR